MGFMMCETHFNVNCNFVSATLFGEHQNGNLSCMVSNAQIGSVIRSLRKRSGKTIESLAYDAGVDRGNLSRIERGQLGVSIESLSSLAASLGLSVSDLLKLAEQPSGETHDLVGLILTLPDEHKRDLLTFMEKVVVPQSTRSRKKEGRSPDSIGMDTTRNLPTKTRRENDHEK